MLLRSFPQLLGKEFRELFASRAYWLMLLFVGALVGHGFITAVGVYAEMSGNGSGAAALPQGLTPLDGILVPTWGAYDLAATLLFPFVAIRLVAAEKESGALKLLLQLPGTLAGKLLAKGLVLATGWVVAWLPGIVSLLLWKSYGGHLYKPELANLLLGHLLRGLLAAGLAFAAAALAESAASAAIITLAITVGTWALDFIAAGRGGLLQQLASYTPTAALRSFEQGLLSLNTVTVMFVLCVGGFALAPIWLHTGRALRFRLLFTGVLIVVLFGIAVICSGFRASWDMSENRRNSFSMADEASLRTIKEPLKISVYLAPEDPRLTDFEQGVLKKLRRVVGRLDVAYPAGTRTGLFENAADHYGEIWYEMGGRRVMERSTIEQVALDQIYQLAGVTQPVRPSEGDFPGYPLSVEPKLAAIIFYLVWPLAVILVWWRLRK